MITAVEAQLTSLSKQEKSSSPSLEETLNAIEANIRKACEKGQFAIRYLIKERVYGEHNDLSNLVCLRLKDLGFFTLRQHDDGNLIININWD